MNKNALQSILVEFLIFTLYSVSFKLFLFLNTINMSENNKVEEM